MNKMQIRQRVSELRRDYDVIMRVHQKFLEVKGLCNMSKMRQLAEWARLAAVDIMKEIESLLHPKSVFRKIADLWDQLVQALVEPILSN